MSKDYDAHTSEDLAGWSDPDDTEETPEPEYEADDPRKQPRRWTRWLPFGIAAAVLIFGIVSLVFSITRRAEERQAAEIAALRQTIKSEEAQLDTLQTDYDAAKDALEKKQTEFDEVQAKLDAGLVEDPTAGAQSLDDLKAAAGKAQEEYSAALEAYDRAIDAVEQNAPGYDEAKNQLAKIEPFLSYATAYQQFVSGASDELPGVNPEEWEDGLDAQEWYSMMVYPAATQAGFTLPSAVDAFPAAVQALTTEPAAKVKAYEDALAASKDAEARLAAANTAQEDAANAYAEGKEAQKTSEDWLADCEQEIARLEKRVQDLETSIQDVTASLQAHRDELKKLENK